MYFELEKHSMTTQILIMPEGVSSAHRDTNLALYRRRLTSVTPRKTWRQAQSPQRSTALLTAYPELTPAKVVEQISEFMATYFNSLAEAGWKLRNQVITVEVTAEDLEDSRTAKTPYKVLGRVWKVRKKLGFPKEFIVIPEPASSSTPTPTYY
jgi:hypothetical protein